MRDLTPVGMLPRGLPSSFSEANATQLVRSYFPDAEVTGATPDQGGPDNPGWTVEAIIAGAAEQVRVEGYGPAAVFIVTPEDTP